MNSALYMLGGHNKTIILKLVRFFIIWSVQSMTLLSPKVFLCKALCRILLVYTHIKSENIITTIFWVVVSLDLLETPKSCQNQVFKFRVYDGKPPYHLLTFHTVNSHSFSGLVWVQPGKHFGNIHNNSVCGRRFESFAH